jgi:lipopolysaccharide transport system ATP-binding protein
MSDTVIKVENISKLYRLGVVGTGTLRHDFNRWWHKVRGREDPYLKIGETNDRTVKSDSDYVWALKDINFEVKCGDVLGIIGRNGAGKSTLLKILSRVTMPTSGEIKVKGRIASLLEVGTGFNPELTGRDNIYLNGAILGMRKREIDRKFDEIVTFAEVERYIDTPVKRYSSGMSVRLAFAVAAHLEPEILIVDEVLAVGDAEFQKKCLGKMQSVATKEGRTVLFVSHNTSAIERLCSKIVLLANGRMQVNSQEVRQVLSDYLSVNNADGGAGSWQNIRNEFQNPWFRPISFCLTDKQGNSMPPRIRNDADVWIEVKAQITERDPALTVGYAIYSDNGTLLYWSYQTDEEPTHWPLLPLGACKLRSRLPRRLLNEGHYRLELIGGLHMRQWLFQPGNNCPAFNLSVTGGLSDSPLWMSGRPGLLAPVLRWEVVEPLTDVGNENDSDRPRATATFS